MEKNQRAIRRVREQMLERAHACAATDVSSRWRGGGRRRSGGRRTGPGREAKRVEEAQHVPYERGPARLYRQGDEVRRGRPSGWDGMAMGSSVPLLPGLSSHPLRLPERNNHPATVSRRVGGLVVSADLIRSIVICRHHIYDYDLPLLGMLNGRQRIVYRYRSDDEYLRLF